LFHRRQSRIPKVKTLLKPAVAPRAWIGTGDRERFCPALLHTPVYPSPKCPRLCTDERQPSVAIYWVQMGPTGPRVPRKTLNPRPKTLHPTEMQRKLLASAQMQSWPCPWGCAAAAAGAPTGTRAPSLASRPRPCLERKATIGCSNPKLGENEMTLPCMTLRPSRPHALPVHNKGCKVNELGGKDYDASGA
jgi:hypothetical protein